MQISLKFLALIVLQSFIAHTWRDVVMVVKWRASAENEIQIGNNK